MPFSALETEAAVIAKAADCLENGITGWQDQLKEEREDLAFAFNEQWNKSALSIRDKSKRPAYTLNVIDRLVDHVSGQSRQNPQQITVRPAGRGSSRFTAFVAESILRDIQRSHSTQVATTWALECAARLGRGYFRIFPDYEHENSFDVVLRIGRIHDIFTVIADPRAYETDGSDMDFCIILHWLLEDEYRAEYGDIGGIHGMDLDSRILERWFETEGDRIKRVLVGEFFWREFPGKQWLVEQSDGSAELLTQDRKPSNGAGRVREAKVPVTKMAVVAGHKQLTDPVEWPSPRIPVYMVAGREVIGDGKRILKSVTRNTRDAQRVVNTSVTSSAETVAAMVKAPFVGSWASVSKYWKRFWSRANDPTTLLLPYDADPDLPDGGRPTREPHAPNVAGQAALLAQSLDLVRWTSGVSEEATGVSQGASQSGRAAIASATFSDVNTFAFHDNLGRQLQAMGEDMVHHLFPAFYSGERLVGVIFSDDQREPEGETIGINGATVEGQEDLVRDAATRARVNLPPDFLTAKIWAGRYQVAVTTSRAYPTRRIEAQEAITGFLQFAPPEMAAVLLPVLLETSDWPGAMQVATAIREKFPDLWPGAGTQGEGQGQEAGNPPGENQGPAGPNGLESLLPIMQQVAAETMAQMHQSPEFAEYVADLAARRLGV